MKTRMFNKINWAQGLTALFLALVLMVYAAPVWAQTTDLKLSVQRDFGFSSGEKIRGTFSMSVIGPENLQSVTFFIDGQSIGEATASPWKLQFNTGDYSIGVHQLSATATTTDGQQLTSNVRTFDFVTSDEEFTGVQQIILPILGLVGGFIVVMMLAQFLLFRKSKRNALPLGEPRNYGMSGGAICPKCHRPFPIHWWAINLLPMTKLEFCPHCGKVVVARRTSEDKLRQAEKAELAWNKANLPTVPVTVEDKVREQIDESKYMNS